MTCQQQPAFDIAAFRDNPLFRKFSDPTKYPDDDLQAYYAMSFCWMDPFFGCCNEEMRFLLVAHLANISDLAAKGKAVTGPVTSATIDKVSVTLQALTTKNAWGQFLATPPPYGMLLWAMLDVKSSGGFFVGGHPEGLGFRKVFGSFR